MYISSTDRRPLQKKWWTNPFVMLAATSVAVVISISLWKKPSEAEKSDPAAVLDQEISQFASEVSDLREKVRTSTSSAGVEKMIRDQLLMQKEGEYIVQIPEPSQVFNSELTSQKNVSNWQKWRELFLSP